MNYIPPGHATRASVKKNKGQNGPPKASKMPPPIVDDPNSADGLKHILVSKVRYTVFHSDVYGIITYHID